MELKYHTLTAKYVDSFELARYLSEKTGKNVEFIETPNDTDYSVEIKKGEVRDYDKGNIDDFLNKGYISFEYGYRAVLNYCADQGWLEEGDYVIGVSW